MDSLKDLPTLQFGIGVSPNDAGMAIVSISSGGAVGHLNRIVLEAYGYIDTFNGELLNLKEGFYWLEQEKKKPVLFILTVDDIRSTANNLRTNLYKGVAAYLPKMVDKLVWLPLMGTGAGGLTLKESFDITSAALQDIAYEVLYRNVSFMLAIPAENEGKKLHSFLKELSAKTKEPSGNLINEGKFDEWIHTTRQRFYFAGANWEKGDQAERFYQQGIWETEFDDEDHNYQATINKIAAGDFIILKSALSSLEIKVKAIGRVTHNPRNGSRLSVAWDVRGLQIDMEEQGYYGNTISPIENTDLINVLTRIGWDDLAKAGLRENVEEAPAPAELSVFKNTIAGLISDSDTGDDHMDIRKDVMAFARIMAARSFGPPLAIALFGRYGAGKSFFMKKLREQIVQLSEKAGSNIYCQGIVQIHFNAWSYLDANLWASIVTRIFDGLNEYISDNTRTEAEKNEIKQQLSKHLAITKEEIDVLEKQKESISEKIENLEDEKKKLKVGMIKILRRIAEHTVTDVAAMVDEKFEVKKKINDALAASPSYINSEVKLREIIPEELWKNPDVLYKEVRSKYVFLRTFFRKDKIGWNLCWLIMIILIIYFVPPMLAELTGKLKDISFALPQATLSILFVARACWDRWRGTYKELQPLIASFWRIKENYDRETKTEQEKFNRRLEALRLQIDNGKTEIVALDNKIQQANIQKADLDFRINNTLATEALYSFIERRSNSDDYKKHLGLVSIIRNDFEVLSQLFGEHNMEIPEVERFGKKLRKPLERIILYIDDLDRCSEERVVEVLGAVNLLMAFPLFIVVVGVDPRWVKNALLKRHQLQFGANGIDGTENIEVSNYLEKIFQVPFHLKEATDDSVKEMLEKLSYSKPLKEDIDVDEDLLNEIASDLLSDQIEDQIEMGVPAEAFEPEKQKEDATEILTISEKEIALMKSLSTVIGTNPRAIKRFVNIYRIMKAHEELTFDRSEENKELHVLMFLLALTTGPFKTLKKKFYQFISDPSSGAADLNDFLVSEKHLGEKLSGEATIMLKDLPILSYKKHIKFLKRFTFEE